MAATFIKVKINPDRDETIRIPIGDDNSVLLSTVAGFVPGISALKYMDTHSNEWTA
jgi:hypothetical protein